MTLRNCFLVPWNPPKASQRLRHFVLWPSESAFWHLETLLGPRSASSSPSEPQQCLRDCLTPWPRFCFYDLPKLPFGTWPSETGFCRLEALLRPRRLTHPPRASGMPQRLPQRSLRRLRVQTDFWHPETLLRSRSASRTLTLRNCFLTPWNPPKASQRLRHLVLWPSENAFCHLETLLRPRSASSTPPEPQECLRDCLRAVPQKAPSTLCFYDPPKLTFGTLKPS